ncbi:MAG: M23 family metallopeptidase, partial [Tepidisphaeraceae bacterium]
MPIDFKRHRFSPVIQLPDDYEVFDFRDGYDPRRAHKSAWGVGKYNEKRAGMYMTDLFGGVRDIHVGIDIAAPVGTECRAFWAGAIHLQGYNGAPGDYGYTIITRHVIDDVELFALYGHLSKESVEARRQGREFDAAD